MKMLQRFIWNSHKNSYLITMELLLFHSHGGGCGVILAAGSASASHGCLFMILWASAHGAVTAGCWCARMQQGWRKGTCSALPHTESASALWWRAGLHVPKAPVHPQRCLLLLGRAVVRLEELQSQEERCRGGCSGGKFPLPWVFCREMEVRSWNGEQPSWPASLWEAFLSHNEMGVVVCKGAETEMCVRGHSEFNRDVKLDKKVEKCCLWFWPEPGRDSTW